AGHSGPRSLGVQPGDTRARKLSQWLGADGHGCRPKRSLTPLRCTFLLRDAAGVGGPEPSYLKKSILAVARSYIAPAMRIFFVLTSSTRTGLVSRRRAIVSSTFFRATASTNLASLLERSPV